MASTSVASTEQPPFRLLFTLAIGLGFGTTAITWTFYNTFMISFLQNNFQTRYAWMTETFLGFVMTWDNIIAIFVQPWIGAKSDNTSTRFGRRTPYILVGLPLAAIFFALIPKMKDQSIFFLIIIVLAFNMSMAIYRSPVVALMPDLTPPVHRTKANGIINLMGGVFAGIALFYGGALVKQGKLDFAFFMMSVIMVIALLLFLLLVREPKELEKMKGITYNEAPEVKVNIWDEFKNLFRSEDKSMLFILLALFSWFIAWNAMEVWLPPYIAVNILHTQVGTSAYQDAVGEAGSALFLVPVVFVVATIPGGYLGYYFQRRTIIKVGLVVFVAAMVFGLTQTTKSGAALSFIIAGAAWGLINVNSIVIVWELAKEKIGAGTGLYYLFSSLAAIVGPITFGMLLDITDSYYNIWYFAIFWLVVAFLFMFLVKSGEHPRDFEPLEGMELD